MEWVTQMDEQMNQQGEAAVDLEREELERQWAEEAHKRMHEKEPDDDD